MILHRQGIASHLQELRESCLRCTHDRVPILEKEVIIEKRRPLRKEALSQNSSPLSHYYAWLSQRHVVDCLNYGQE